MECEFVKKHGTCSLACLSFGTTCPETRLRPEEKATILIIALAFLAWVVLA